MHNILQFAAVTSYIYWKLSTNADEHNIFNLSAMNSSETQVAQSVQKGKHKATDTVTLLNGVTD